MENKLRKKFIIYTIVSLFILLFITLFIINFSNFSIVSDEADRVTEMIQSGKGSFNEKDMAPEGEEGDGRFKMPPGPDSKEIGQTTRYFVVKFNKDGNPSIVKHKINTFTEDEAIAFATSLIERSDSVGWTNTSYRYRVYADGKAKYVIVIDQSRELRTSYHVLWLSLGVLVGGTLLAFAILLPFSKRIIQPVVDSDKKQKRFIKDATRSMKTPLTIIEESNELLKEKDQELTKSIDMQLANLNWLLNNMNTLTILQDENPHNFVPVDINKEIELVIDDYIEKFNKRGIILNCSIAENISFNTTSDLFRKLFKEIVDNGAKYANSLFSIKITKSGDRLTIETNNDLKNEVKDSPQDRVFERFYRMENEYTNSVTGNGMGLAIVKEIADIHNGRCKAKTENNQFILKIEL